MVKFYVVLIFERFLVVRRLLEESSASAQEEVLKEFLMVVM